MPGTPWNALFSLLPPRPILDKEKILDRWKMANKKYQMPNVASPKNNQHKDLLLTDLSFIPKTTEVSIRTPYWTNKMSFQKDQLEDVLDGMISDAVLLAF